MFEKKSIESCEKELETNCEKGLSSEEAKRRLERNGKNALDEGKKKSIFYIFPQIIREVLSFETETLDTFAFGQN